MHSVHLPCKIGTQFEQISTMTSIPWVTWHFYLVQCLIGQCEPPHKTEVQPHIKPYPKWLANLVSQIHDQRHNHNCESKLDWNRQWNQGMSPSNRSRCAASQQQKTKSHVVHYTSPTLRQHGRNCCAYIFKSIWWKFQGVELSSNIYWSYCTMWCTIHLKY
jgi:hypothetical protein